MEDREIKERLAMTMAEVLGIRNILLHLIVYQAKKNGGADELLRYLSESSTDDLYLLSQQLGDDELSLKMQEAARKQADLIVSFAHKHLAK